MTLVGPLFWTTQLTAPGGRLPRSSRLWHFFQDMRTRIQKVIDTLSFVFNVDQQDRAIRLSRRGMAFRPLILSEWFMALGLWEPYVRERLKLPEGWVFIDVGAHIGYFSRLAAQMIPENGLVVCIEPDPRNLALLRQNTSQFQHVLVLEKACGQTRGKGYLLSDSNPLFTSVSSERGETEVEFTTLDDIGTELLSSFGAAGKCIVKIDVEGAALEVIQGGKNFIKSFCPEIILEVAETELSKLEDLLPGFSVEPLAKGYYYLYPSDTGNLESAAAPQAAL